MTCTHHLLHVEGLEQTLPNSHWELEVLGEGFSVHKVTFGSARLCVDLTEACRDLPQLHGGELRHGLLVVLLERRLTLTHCLRYRGI